LDELDVRIYRALIADGTPAPALFQVRTSLREIARKLGADDMTVFNRYKRFQEIGLLSGWKLVINPRLFGFKVKDIMVDVHPESMKDDAIRKLRLVHGIMMIASAYGSSLAVQVVYNSADELSRTMELISRITNTERLLSVDVPFPDCETKRLTQTDWDIIRALRDDARKSHVAVAKELGLSSRTVKNRITRLAKEKAIMVAAEGNVAFEGVIPAMLLFSYSNDKVKDAVDQAMLSHFDGNYLWARLTNPEHGFVFLVAPNMTEVKHFVDWAKQQPGVAMAEIRIVMECITLYDKFAEMVSKPLATIKAAN
jgi:DNA-binding Lrp family transcriptional regulator